ncbi:hypothetical protein FHR81_001140 [Actinoalloteichus hoggarensis]|uniref:Uncharacterized protein n=1 Tax=Actinoalloteichus hoggarensis TaxID=1470176 RepID=A0A221VZB6_9PSEU|nr:hypothetical protein [Actinoalloteichus hoggarensis]ASO18875.1 hypothetical protein AHOG_06115 [Actinoalloteichus hoggarensis]MBB5920110.1 hypothetical protein [Actinoalloteichus hoggarensis]
MSLIPRTVPGDVPDHNRAALQRRWNRIRPMLITALFGLPVCQLVIFGVLFVERMGPGGVFATILPGISTIVVLVQLIRGDLLTMPSEWKYSTLLNGLLSVIFLVLPFFGDSPSTYGSGFQGPLIIIALLIPVACLLLVRQARHILIAAPVSVVGASAFTLTYPLRSNRWSASVHLDGERINWQAARNTISRNAGNMGSQIDVDGSFPLAAVRDTSVRIVRDVDDGRAWMRGHLWRLHCPPGPGLVLHTKDGEWVLPVKNADELGPLLLARAESVRARSRGDDDRHMSF